MRRAVRINHEATDSQRSLGRVDRSHAPRNSFLYTQGPVHARSRYAMVRLAGFMPLSLGNIFQAYLIKLALPDSLFESVLTEELFNQMNNSYLVRYEADRILYSLAYLNRYPDASEYISSLTRQLMNFYAVARSFLPPNDGHVCPNDPSPPPDNDDLPERIARELATIYFDKLEITVSDIQTVINYYFATGESIQAIDDVFIGKIVHANIDKNRIALRNLLSEETIIQVAVDGLRTSPSARPPIPSGTPEYVYSAPDAPGGYQHYTSLERYKIAVTKTMDKYISWWKMSWFGHHHDERARAVKAAIQCAESQQAILDILKRQQQLVGPDVCGELPVTSMAKRWNLPDTVKHKYPVSQSGYFKVMSEAITVSYSVPTFTP